MTTCTFPASKQGSRQDLLDSHIEPFLKHLRAAGYAERTLRKKQTVAVAFARWTESQQVSVDDLNDSHVAAFVERMPRRRKAQLKLELATLPPLLKYLRAGAGDLTPPSRFDMLPTDDLARRYTDYLRKGRGLAANSIRVYAPFVRDFLLDQSARSGSVSPSLFDATAIRDFLLERTRNRSGEYSRLLATALRSFFRFLFLSGELPVDLSNAVPGVRKWRQSAVPAFLSPEDVERVLSATDRSTPSGCRDCAILLLLARLGLRAGEVVTLELGDIRWRTGEIIIRGKGRIRDHLPLLSDVGEALASYLSTGRGATASRRVFVRTLAPRIALTGPAAVGHVVRRALAQAGVSRPGRSAAHLFRHGLATRMIRQGASLAEIAEVLRHRSQSTTAIYAKVSVEALRGVALPWPVTGGAR